MIGVGRDAHLDWNVAGGCASRGKKLGPSCSESFAEKLSVRGSEEVVNVDASGALGPIGVVLALVLELEDSDVIELELAVVECDVLLCPDSGEPAAARFALPGTVEGGN
jgi:hypothetical protein